jgi:hypothetical protein
MKAFCIKFIFLITATMIIGSCKNEKAETEKKSEIKISKEDKISSAGEKESGIEFNVQYSFPRKIYKIVKEDLNKDGSREIIVLSVLKDSAGNYNDYYNFDMMEIFSLDKEKSKFKKIFSDTVDYSTEIMFEDLDKTGFRQILVKTNSGGNDEIASDGMFVFGMNEEGSVKLINYFDTGNPELKDLKNNGIKQILVSDEYWGVMPQVNVITFVKDIYSLENGMLVIKNSDYPEFYTEKIKELKERYYGVKRKVEMGMQLSDLSYPLYREALEVIVNCYAKGDMKELGLFWKEEKESLKKNIPQDEFTDLSNFVYKVLPSAQNA